MHFQKTLYLPLSHDEVVHGKKSLLDKMTGDEWQRFASLKIIICLLYDSPREKTIIYG